MVEASRTPPVWEQQFDPAFDFDTAIPATKYAICTSPRCGSHFLGHLLHQAGGFGYPLEYVQRANLARWTQRAQQAGSPAALDYIKSVRTDSNGVFGIKLHYRHLPAFLQHEPAILDYKFITLERYDLVKQAVSYSYADQTGSWISAMESQGSAEYNWESIAGKLAEITRSNAGWRSFLAGLGIEPLHLYFEDVRKHPDDAVRRIGTFLGVEPQWRSRPGSFSPAEQVASAKGDWVQRFVTDSRARLQRGDLLPSRGEAQSWWGRFRARVIRERG